MKIGIISDIHDHIPRLHAALRVLSGCGALVCCGDLCSPFIIKEMALHFEQSIHVVFGNNDGDRYRIAQGAGKYPHVHIHGEFVELDLDGKSFAINHFDNLARAMAGSDKYDVICFGHNHQFEITRAGRALLVNPGEVYGLLTGRSTCAVYDTETHAAERIDVDA